MPCLLIVMCSLQELKQKSPLNMQVPKLSPKAVNLLFTFEHRDAFQQAERVGSCEN